LDVAVAKAKPHRPDRRPGWPGAQRTVAKAKLDGLIVDRKEAGAPGDFKRSLQRHKKPKVF